LLLKLLCEPIAFSTGDVKDGDEESLAALGLRLCILSPGLEKEAETES
jgi:hypothetical protein